MRIQSGIYAKIGLVLIIGSCLLWVAVLVIPFLPVSLAKKAVIATSLVLISEVMFWLGILLAGKELAQRYRHQLNPIEWYRKITRRR
jgi:hypothetical protein